MSSNIASLSRPLRLASGEVLRNRISKAATSEKLGTSGGGPSDGLIELYRRWGAGGSGLLITGNVVLDWDGREADGNVVLDTESGEVHAEALARWASAARAGGAGLWMQINHAGRQSPRRATRRPVAPSTAKMRGLMGLFAKPQALDEPGIESIIESFAYAATRAKTAGFTGVQIHAAHGYLVSQFLSPLANQRTDRWGGSLENRARFLLEILRRTRAAVGKDFTVAAKLNSADFQRGGFDGDESMAVVEMLQAEGLDLLEISGGNYESPAMMGSESTRSREAYFIDYAESVRARTSLPLMVTGGFRTAAAMASAIEGGAVDLVGMARPLIVEPDLPRRLLAGEATAAVEYQLKMRSRMATNMLQGLWHLRQLERMAAGKDPDLGMSHLWTLVSGAARQYAFNPLSFGGRRRKPAGLLVAANGAK